MDVALPLLARAVLLACVPGLCLAAEVPIDPRDLAGTALLTFNDDFDGFQTWNGTNGWDTKWSYAPPEGARGYNGELQWYVHAGYGPTGSVVPWVARDGILQIAAARAEPQVRPHIGGAEYTSGMINTFHAFSQTYGYFEIRASLPAGRGLWPAFWMLPVARKSQEIDVMEVLGHEPSMLYNAVHSYAPGTVSSVGHGTRVEDTSAGFHTYGLLWTAEDLSFYFDGRQTFSTPTPPDMHEPMFLIVNLAVGGTEPGEPDGGTRFPSFLKVDYVRAYARKAGRGAPGSRLPALLYISAEPRVEAEGADRDSPMVFAVIRSGDSSGTTTVRYAVTGWARNGANAADFVGGTLPSGSVSFGPGETSKSVAVAVADDSTPETEEGFTIDLQGASEGAVIVKGSASGRIVDDDGAPERVPTPAPAAR